MLESTQHKCDAGPQQKVVGIFECCARSYDCAGIAFFLLFTETAQH